MDNISIRPAQESDLIAILSILNEEIKFGTSVYDYDEKSLTDIGVWYQEKINLGFPLLVAELDQIILGYATFGYFRPREGYKHTVEHSVYIAKKAQGNGVGQLLMDKLIPIAVKQNFHRMLAVVDASNEGSCAFHKKLGFKEVGRLNEVGYKFNKWLDVVFMQLNLDTININ